MFLLIGIYPLQCLTTTIRHVVTKKEEDIEEEKLRKFDEKEPKDGGCLLTLDLKQGIKSKENFMQAKIS